MNKMVKAIVAKSRKNRPEWNLTVEAP